MTDTELKTTAFSSGIKTINELYNNSVNAYTQGFVDGVKWYKEQINENDFGKMTFLEATKNENMDVFLPNSSFYCRTIMPLFTRDGQVVWRDSELDMLDGKMSNIIKEEDICKLGTLTTYHNFKYCRMFVYNEPIKEENKDDNHFIDYNKIIYTFLTNSEDDFEKIKQLKEM